MAAIVRLTSEMARRVSTAAGGACAALLTSLMGTSVYLSIPVAHAEATKESKIVQSQSDLLMPNLRQFPPSENLSARKESVHVPLTKNPTAVDTATKPALNLNNPDVALIAGSTCNSLARQIAVELNKDAATSGAVHLVPTEVKRFADGETSIVIGSSMRGKDVFIVSTCAPSVNDSVVELLLSIAAARRAGAASVTAVIPYFGYKLNRRGLPLSTFHSSRFLWNAASDVAVMLAAVGADKVISVDIQRPGQGHEACFFKNSLPAETITTNDLFVEYFASRLSADSSLDPVDVVIVSPNTELVKKAKKFTEKLSSRRSDLTVDFAVFLRADSDVDTVHMKGNLLSLSGDVSGKDVILIEDYLDSGIHISTLCNRLMREGARRVFICASHGSFDKSSLELIQLSPASEVVVTDSIELPASASNSKIVQLSLAPLLANVIRSDIAYAIASEFNPDGEDDHFVPE